MPSADQPDVYLAIEVIVSDVDDYVILGCQRTGLYPSDEKLPCLVKYSDQGVRDTEFGSDGYAFIDLMRDAETNGMGRLLNVVSLPDGGYLARLEATKNVESGGVKNERSCIALARFTKGGQKDTAFGLNGIAVIPLDPPTDVSASKAGSQPERTLGTPLERAVRSSDFPPFVLGDMKLLPDGKVLVFASAVNNEENHRSYLVRVLEDGSLDTTLNGSGKAELKTETWFRPHRIGFQTEDGRFVVSGERPGIPFIARFRESGELDESYGDGGYFTDLSDYTYAAWHQLLALDDNTLVCVGHAGSSQASASLPGVVAVAKIDHDGHKIAEFNGGQTLFIRAEDAVAGFSLWSFSALIDKFNRIVIAGRRLDVGLQLSSFIARLKQDGSRDPQMGTNGVIYHPEPKSFNAFTEHQLGKGYYATGYVPNPDNSIVNKLYRITS